MYGQEQEAPVSGGFMNVSEDFEYYDSVLVYFDLDHLSLQPPGWFQSFAALGGANQLSFFDVRNRANTDLAWCNVETRDMTAFPMRINKIGVSFWAPSNHNLYFIGTDPFMDSVQANFWESDLPRHVSVKARIAQDERLKTTAFMVPGGCAPTVGGFAHLSNVLPTHSSAPVASGFGAGVAHRNNQWIFPADLNIPRNAALSVVLELNEYARTCISRFSTFAPLYRVYQPVELRTYSTVPFGVTVSISGKREVQQRGQAHV